jgi:hypothetical protein
MTTERQPMMSLSQLALALYLTALVGLCVIRISG